MEKNDCVPSFVYSRKKRHLSDEVVVVGESNDCTEDNIQEITIASESATLEKRQTKRSSNLTKLVRKKKIVMICDEIKKQGENVQLSRIFEKYPRLMEKNEVIQF